MNILHLTARAKPEKEYELKQAIRSALDRTGKYEDVKNCFYKSIFEEQVFLIEQEWNSNENTQSYLQSKDFQYLKGAIKVLGELVEQRIFYSNTLKEF